MTLTSLTAACNRLHSIDERLCRWLSMTFNRAQRREFPLLHEFLAQMGVHRPTISTAANMLQKAGLISYRYGKMTIVDPDGLADGACECYPLMEEQIDKIFDQPWREKVRIGIDVG
jgi:DNA-binding transcriptional regulator YhcF (GntR family)